MIRKFVTAAALGLGLLSAATPSLAAEEGYREINRPALERADGKIQVTEYFWYGCPHCYKLEPAMKAWEQNLPDDVVFTREAPPLNQSWQVHAKAFYAALLMGEQDKLHEPLFHAIHRDRTPLYNEEQLSKFAAEKGLDGQKFASMMKSFAVNGRLSQARQQAVDYRLTGVPAIVINGKYVTSPSQVGSPDQVPVVINQLIEKIRQERAVTQPSAALEQSSDNAVAKTTDAATTIASD